MEQSTGDLVNGDDDDTFKDCIIILKIVLSLMIVFNLMKLNIV